MSTPVSQMKETNLQKKSAIINKFLKIYKSLWARLFPFKDNYEKLHEEIERLKIELKDEKEISFVLNKLLVDQKLLQGLDDFQHSQRNQVPNSSDRKSEAEVQIELYEEPKIIMDGSLPFKIEMFTKIIVKDFVDEYGDELAIGYLFLKICELLRKNLILSKKNKKIIKSNGVKEIVVNWHPANPKPYTFISISELLSISATSRATEDACFFLNNFNLDLKSYLNCMRAAIRNEDVELLKTVLKILCKGGMYWHNLFPLLSEERNTHPHDDYDPFRPYYLDFKAADFNLAEYLAQPENQNARCYSPLSYALAKGPSYQIIRTLLDFGSTEKLVCRGYTIDVSKEIAEFLKLEQQRKTAFLMAFNARLGQDSEIFRTLVKSPISDAKNLTRAVFDML